MDLMSSLKEDIWQTSEAEKHSEFAEYTVIRSHMEKPGLFKVAVKQLTDEGDIPHIMATLEGTRGKKNPLASVRNCDLLVKEKEIIGISLDGDCVITKKAL